MTTTVKGGSRILALAATGLASLFAACSLPHDETRDDTSSDDASTSDDTNDAGGSSSGTSSGGGSSGGGSSSGLPISSRPTSACKAGFYEGPVAGSYFSDTGLDALSVTGNIKFALSQQGSSDQMCSIEIAGEGVTTEVCSNVFVISGATIEGVMANPGDGATGDVPYSCVVTGTLDCGHERLANGWMQCSYCAGPGAGDAGSCEVGADGRFAGPLTAAYDTTTVAFLGGTWNGAEALAGNDGGTPGPDGGPFTDYLALDGGYGDGRYGGSGGWSATCTDCE
jgi:hypothetical protein